MSKIEFWKDREKKSVDPTLYSKTAENFAMELAQDCKNSKLRLNKPTQLRKFYDEVLRLEMAAKTRKGDWDNILPLVHMITAKAAYAQGRKLVSNNFLDFIKSAVDQIGTPEDLKVFTNFFEASMGFYKMHCPVK
jgi:CRISPR-associated protein Csm2